MVFIYYVFFIDEFPRYTWIYKMHRKNEVLNHFMKLVVTCKNSKSLWQHH